jgi:uncharacterized membrane protein YozB (DUF420 family)
MTWTDLPAVNASLNSLATVFMLAGFVFIKAGRRDAHRRCMVGALASSVVFLACYVAYHLATGAKTPFGGTGFWRPVYYTILISHVILAMAVVPLVLVTVRHAWKGAFEKHKAWARVTFPIWLYVSVTGVLVYFFLYQWFPPAVAPAVG